jgi:hypothetical protein
MLALLLFSVLQKYYKNTTNFQKNDFRKAIFFVKNRLSFFRFYKSSTKWCVRRVASKVNSHIERKVLEDG